MKILFFVMLALTPCFSQMRHTKRALLIGVGQYSTGSGWAKLAGDADVDLMQQTLSRQGFMESNIVSLKNEKATKKDIENAVADLILSAAKDDIIVVFFSGHGKQVPDQKNGDETDGMDEAIVPFDSKMNSNEQVIIDDRINEWITSLRKQVMGNGHVLLLLNSCHSGTGSKGADAESVNNCENESKVINPAKNINKPAGKNLGKFVAMEASFTTLVTRQIRTPDGKWHGALTYALAVAFANVKKNGTYLSFFDNVYETMYGNSQRPCMEGDSPDLNQLMFDGAVVESSMLHKITEYLGNKVRIAGGYLNYVDVAAKFKFIADMAKGASEGKPVAMGTVVEAGPFESIVEIENGKIGAKELSLTGIMVEQSFAEFRIGVSFKNLKNATLKKYLQERMQAKRILSVHGEAPEVEIIEERDAVLITSLPTGFLFARIKKEGEYQEHVVNKIIDYARARIITGLQIKNVDYQAEITLRHCTIDSVMTGGVKKARVTFYTDPVNRSLVFNGNEEGWFTIKNTGNKPFYFTLLDIQPDGIINAILPDQNKGWSSNDVKVGIGQEKSFPMAPPVEPYGMEMFKVILSPQYTDFSFLASRRRLTEDEKGNENPVAALFKDLSEGGLDRTKGSLPSVGGTAELVFQIIAAPK